MPISLITETLHMHVSFPPDMLAARPGTCYSPRGDRTATVAKPGLAEARHCVRRKLKKRQFGSEGTAAAPAWITYEGRTPPRKRSPAHIVQSIVLGWLRSK
ncbi:hypothetical protein ONZ51_g523 [Trametes cubensis]|uniref:Uncharacterized protein n=1 Tax=Trametes cubensis TaxID=1111947 RepID=A0AAD7U3B7_9APHY|nr:hypothetical protein ONZ51_g523 [Trametes cubensis]